jgi:hypothetical protein
MAMIQDAHMPFLLVQDGRQKLLYCAAAGELTIEQELARTNFFFREPQLSNPKWDAAREKIRAESTLPTKVPRYKVIVRDLESGEEQDLTPDLAESATVCSPYLIDGELQLILTDAGVQKNLAAGELMVKPSWASTIYGFRSGTWQAWVTESRQVVQWHAGDEPRVFSFDLPADAQIYRLAPIHDAPGEWLLTFVSGTVGHTLHWDGASLREIFVAGKPIYKSSIQGDMIAWSGGQTDSRTIDWQDGFEHGPALACETADIPDRRPTLLELANNFLRGFSNYAASGFKPTPADVFNQRLDICRTKCPGKLWSEDAVFGIGRCGKCGCTTLKLDWASEKCPLGAWKEVS